MGYAAMKYRLVVRRPEVGFDYHYMWGSLDQMLGFWLAERKGPSASQLYFQKASAKGLEDCPIDAEQFEALARERLGAWALER